jgi:hypothetical protein
MRTLRFVALVLCVAGVAFSADPAPAPRTIEQIRKEMTAIRRGTNWGDAAAAQLANERIAQLTEEMLRVAKPKRPEEQASAAEAAANNTADPNAGGLDQAKLGRQFIMQAAEAVAGGKSADMPLAKQVRDQIVADYQADVDPAIKCPEVLQNQTTLVIDCSSPAAQAVIDQMEKFRGIRTLVITGGRTGAPVDLPAILKKARAYPLRELYIISFHQFVAALPPETVGFAELKVLGVFGNSLTELPAGVGGLRDLETLFVDGNPLPTILPVVRPLSKLGKLGVGKTDIPAAELAEIQRLFPNCSLLTQ